MYINRFRTGQYLLFEKGIAKINKIDEKRRLTHRLKDGVKRCAKLRKFTKGNANKGYSWQHIVSLQHLEKLYHKGKVAIISPEMILQILLANYEGCFPIRNVHEVI